MSGNLLLNLVILVAALQFICGVVLLLHRLSLYYGLLPMVFSLGGLAAVLQFRSLGMLTIQWAGHSVPVAIGSYTMLPVLLFGLLIIYLFNGTTQARNTLYGLIIVTIFAALGQILLSIYQALPIVLPIQTNPVLPAPRIPLASAITLILDMLVITTVYQAVSNLRKRGPSRLAGAIALLVALCNDALIFPLLAYAGSSGLVNLITVNLIGKLFSGLALVPAVSVYLNYIQKEPTFTAALFDNAGTNSRPVLDLFSTHLQLEARAQYQYGLLRTVSQINQLILRANQPNMLLQQSCQLLCQGRDYSLVWIGLFDKPGAIVEEASLRAVAKAGPLVERASAAVKTGKTPARRALTDKQLAASVQETLSETVLVTKQANIFKDSTGGTGKRGRMQQPPMGINACAVFPMRRILDDQPENCIILGVLCVHSSRKDTFDNAEEVALLQELADDLAYALVSLEARRQQVILSTATENLNDALLITNLRGDLIYANPATLEMLGYQAQEVMQRRIFDLMPADEAVRIRQEYVKHLVQKGNFTGEITLTSQRGQILISAKAALVRNSRGRARNVVISLRDITARRIYEQRLLALNHIAAEVVQIHDLEKIYQMILKAGVDLLEADASAIILAASSNGSNCEIHPLGMPEECIVGLNSHMGQPDAAIQATFHQPIYLEKIPADKLFGRELRFLPDNGLHAMMSMPIKFQETSQGSLCFFYKAERVFEGAEKQLGLAVGNNLTMAIQNAQLYQAEHRQRQLSEGLAEATSIPISSLEPDVVLDRILKEALHVVPGRSASLMLIEGPQARIVRQMQRTSSGEIESTAGGQKIPLNTPTLMRMMETGEPVLVPDTASNKDWRDFGLTPWIRSYASAPLTTRYEIIGFLNINSEIPDFFTDDILPSLKGFAFNASAALHNARLYRELQARTMDLEDRIHERTEELSSAKDLLEAILTSVPDAVFVLDENGLLLNANRSGAIMLLSTEKSGVDLFAPEFLQNLKMDAARDSVTVVEIQQRAYQILSSPISIKEAQTGTVVIFRDVTHFHELDRMKNQFVSDVSHELRTPLTSLSLYLDLLATETDPERRERFQATLRRETNRLTQLIEDLLTISRLESNRVPIYLQPTDIIRLVNDLTLDRTPIAAQRNINLQCSACAQSAIAEVDVRLITQVLSNLLTNAVNYTSPGGDIHILIECITSDGIPHDDRTQNSPGNWITVAIQDSGVGIAADELPHIFERFYRGTASRQTDAPGTGLGLAISQEILDRMHGRIYVESAIGKGSTFTVWLPAAQVPAVL